MDLRSAIHEASMERFRPIMITTFAALMDALPLAIGFESDASSRRPLGLVIVGGQVQPAAAAAQQEKCNCVAHRLPLDD
jgi:multidrug efflux pump subunit AcrB